MKKQYIFKLLLSCFIFSTQTFFAAESCSKKQQAICIACCSCFITTAACSTCAISTGIVDPSFLLCCGIGCASSYLITSKINCTRSGFTKAPAQPLMEIIIGDTQVQATPIRQRNKITSKTILPPQQTMLATPQPPMLVAANIGSARSAFAKTDNTIVKAHAQAAMFKKKTGLLGIPEEDYPLSLQF